MRNAHFAFPATKKNDSQIKCKQGKNTSETAQILHQDDKKLNSERSTKFEDTYFELEKRLNVQTTKEDKLKKQMQKMKKGSQQSTLEEVSMMPQQQIHQESKTHHSTRAPSMQTQLPKQKKVKGLQQTCNGEEEVMQTTQEDEEQMAKNSSSIPWSQLQQEQQLKRKRVQRNHNTTRMNNDVKKTTK